MTMNAALPELKLSHDSQGDVRTQGRGLKTVATISGIALLLLTAMYWPRGSSDAAPTPINGDVGTVTPFQYFPSQFRNTDQSGPSEEHIQAY
jgi:hypothetical protein